jgi:hypothetical protein
MHKNNTLPHHAYIWTPNPSMSHLMNMTKTSWKSQKNWKL